MDETLIDWIWKSLVDGDVQVKSNICIFFLLEDMNTSEYSVIASFNHIPKKLLFIAESIESHRISLLRLIFRSRVTGSLDNSSSDNACTIASIIIHSASLIQSKLKINKILLLKHDTTCHAKSLYWAPLANVMLTLKHIQHVTTAGLTQSIPVNVCSLLLSWDSNLAIISSTALRISRTRSSLAFLTLSILRSCENIELRT